MSELTIYDISMTFNLNLIFLYVKCELLFSFRMINC